MWTLIALMTSLAQAGPLEDALNQSKKAKDAPKGKAMEFYLQGEIKRKQEKFDEATDLYLQSLMAQPNTQKVLRSMASNFVKAGQYKKAEMTAKRRAELFPEETGPHLALAYVYFKDWSPEKGLAATEKALALKPKNGTALDYQQSFLLTSGRFDDAKAALKVAAEAEVDEKNIACYETRIAAMEQDTEVMNEKWAICETADASDTKIIAEGYKALAEGNDKLATSRLIKAGWGDMARTSMGWKYIEEGKFEQARNLCNAVLKENNRVDSALVSAIAYYQEGSFDKALNLLTDDGRFDDDWTNFKDGVPLNRLAMTGKGGDYQKRVTEESLALIVASYVAKEDQDSATKWAGEAKKAIGGSEKVAKAVKGHWPNEPQADAAEEQ